MTRARTRPVFTGLTLLAGIFVGGCEESAIIAPRFVTQISLTSGDCGGLRVGEDCTLVATALAEDGEPVEDPRLDWRSANLVIATVSSSGVVSGHLPGTALIIVETPNRAVADSTSVRVFEQNPDPEP